MKGSTNNPNMAIAGLCDVCGTLHDNSDCGECDDCGQWTCYECAVTIDGQWLCPDCAERAELDDEAEEVDPQNDPGHPMFVDPTRPDPRDWFYKKEALREYKAQQAEEERGK